MSYKWVRFAVMAVGVVGAAGCTAVFVETNQEAVHHPVEAAPVPPADISLFYDKLQPYGHWFPYASYGWAWTPYDVPYGWRPYTNGRWAYTEYGWTWVSHEPWGWATYHYGRWLFDAGYGWVWVPDHVWAPAWVSWRWSDDWIGWAPLPPGVEWQAGTGMRYGDRNLERDLDAPMWCFVRRPMLLEPSLRVKLEPSPRNVTLLAATKIFTDYDEVDRRPRNKGIKLEEIERSLNRPVPRVKVADATAPEEASHLVKSKEIQVYRPEIVSAADKPPTMTPNAVTDTIPEPVVEQRKEKEQQHLESFFQRQQKHIKSEQRKELRQAPAGTDSAEMRRQHEEELRALDEQKQRELKVIDQRLEKRIIKPGHKAKKGKEKTTAASES